MRTSRIGHALGWILPVAVASGCNSPSSGTTSEAPTASAPAAPTASAATAAPQPSHTPEAAPAASASPAPDTIIAQHILVAYKTAKRAPKGVTRSKADAKARAAEALAKIKAGTSFEDAVKEYSDDAGSADRLGSVGKFHRADMDPAFSDAAFALRPGQVSDVVETPFGFHVIKRTQ
ncbi:MAG: peptidylprolyl isomerase [Polyangiaceae bacterium]